MDGPQIGLRITFDQLTRAEANRAVHELRHAILVRVSDGVSVAIEKDDPDSQDAGQILVLLFGASAGAAIAQAIRAYLSRRAGDRDRITIKTADGTEIVATGEAARMLDTAMLLRVARPTAPSRRLILFLAANPSAMPPLALDEECAAIERELRMTIGRDDFELRAKWAVGVDDLSRHLLELSPTIIHFSGHGARGPDGRGEPASTSSSRSQRDVVAAGSSNSGIYLHGDDGGSQLVTPRALAMLIKSATDSARLVVLNACYSDDQAEALLTTVDCVVGMTGVIGDDAARSFAVALYRTLGNRRSVADAFQHAVATLAAKQLPDEISPRCRTRDGIHADAILLSTLT